MMQQELKQDVFCNTEILGMPHSFATSTLITNQDLNKPLEALNKTDSVARSSLAISSHGILREVQGFLHGNPLLN